MSFWESQLGEITGSAADAFAKSFEVIPNNTRALAEIKSFKHDSQNEFTFLNITWSLVEGEFKGAEVNQKLKVFGGNKYDKDPERTRFKALNMLKLLYQTLNIKPKSNDAPTDNDLLAFQGKRAGIKIRETEPNDRGMQYNWVSEVHKPDNFESVTGRHVKVKDKEKEASFSDNDTLSDDDLPF